MLLGWNSTGFLRNLVILVFGLGFNVGVCYFEFVRFGLCCFSYCLDWGYLVCCKLQWISVCVFAVI